MTGKRGDGRKRRRKGRGVRGEGRRTKMEEREYYENGGGEGAGETQV